MHKAISLLSALFLAFIIWIIYLANTGQNSIFFEFVASIPYGDKLGHFCLFGALTLAANFAFRLKQVHFVGLNIYRGSALVFLFVLLGELSQHFIPNRTLDISDFIADVFGILVFSILTKLFSKRL